MPGWRLPLPRQFLNCARDDYGYSNPVGHARYPCLVPSVFGLRHPTMNWPWDYSQGRIGWSILYPRVHNTPGFPIPRWFGQFDFPKQGPQVLSWLPWWWWLSSSNLGKMIFWNPFCQICPVDQSWGGVFCTLGYTILPSLIYLWHFRRTAWFIPLWASATQPWTDCGIILKEE